jgi:predicted acyltransferase
VTGLWIGSAAPSQQKTFGLLGAAAAGIAIGWAWHPFFPINKNLWTSSYVFFTAGAACLLLAFCYWIVDVRGWRRWTTPFVILGTNAITLFAASALLVKTFLSITVGTVDGEPLSLWSYLYAIGFEPFFDPYVASLLFALANLAVLFALLTWMYRRRMFLRV